MRPLCSTAPLSSWRGDVTFFSGYYNTRPALEESGLTFTALANLIAPEDDPVLIADKERVPYFVPCRLRDAPLLGKTRERAAQRGDPLVGKQRSGRHVTDATWIVADIDGATDDHLDLIRRRLHAAEITHLIYSTYSHGKPEKPGTRSRLVIPIDRALDPAGYRSAAEGLNACILGKHADASGFNLHQQQGVWATHPARAQFAFRQVHKAGIADAAALLAETPKRSPAQPASIVTAAPANPDLERVRGALAWIDPNNYEQWIKVGFWLKAIVGDAAFPLWYLWSETASDASKACNDGRYAPEKVWTSLSPTITAGQGQGALYARARDGAAAAVCRAMTDGAWGTEAKSALAYLRQHHPRRFDDLVHGKCA